jgi:parvulin-like peptidyl-prolyl isomerase
LLLAACNARKGDEDAFLFKIGEGAVSVAEFRRALEREQPNALSDPVDGDLAAALTFLNQMIEERLLLARAREIGVTIEDADLDAAVDKVRADYPDDTFEETLLESAVSFNQWREQLRRRLLLEKVVNQELEQQVEIAPEDVAAYYAENYAGRDEAADAGPLTAESVNAAIITHLRRTKAQEGYPAWIQGLQTRYGLEIDWERWQTLTEKLHPAPSGAVGEGMRLVTPPSNEPDSP